MPTRSLAIAHDLGTRYGSRMRLALLLITLLSCDRTNPKRDNKETVEIATTGDSTVLKSETPRPKVKAHRGSSESAPENTLVAVQLAFKEGADATEIDVRVSKDGAVVVFHDEDTKRIGNRDQLIAEQTLAELRELDVGAWKSEQYAGERIATLTQILSALPVGHTLFVEIKDGVESVPSVLEAIKKTPTNGQVAIESFDVEVLRAVGRAMPQLPLHVTLGANEDAAGVIHPFAPALARDAKTAGFSGLSVDLRGMNHAFADAVYAEGLELAVWTVNHAAVLTLLRDFPITWIESDLPAMIVRELGREHL